MLDVLQQDVVGLVARQPPEALKLAQVPAPPGGWHPAVMRKQYVWN